MVHCGTETYNFNVIRKYSGPSFGVSSKALCLGKSPDKAHWEAGTDCSSVSMRQKPFCEQHQVEEKFFVLFSVKTSEKICVHSLCHPKCADLLFLTSQPVITLSNGVSLIIVAAVCEFCIFMHSVIICILGQGSKIPLWIAISRGVGLLAVVMFTVHVSQCT